MNGGLVASSSSSSSSTSRHIGRWTYDVFLSFRGEDTRKNFVDHLYAALDQAGIYTFKDDQKLQRGESISPALLKAIEESMVAVVVFSKNYANSSWCLDELVKIVESQHLGQRVLPVFYDVDPSDVRGQKGSFHAAFEQHEVKLTDNMDKVERWREAFVTTANLSGWDISRTANGHEAECIKQIVRNILSCTKIHPIENLIGMESRVKDVKSLLGKHSNDVCIIGIWGMGGIGKTTIARAVYNQISYEFEGSCFVEAVRENCFDKKDIKSVQEKLLSEILMEEYFNLRDCDDGICEIRRRLGRKKVLVVLDDVDDFKQLEYLAGAREWFGCGSRIIVTTRDEHLLSYSQEKYAPELLNKTEAMVLFSRYAFKSNIPPKAYEELSGVVVSHSGHLPLALKALGSHFCGRKLGLWRSALRVLTKIPNNEINEILKLSYDGLNILEKKIFLYIACFYKGKERANVTRVLDIFGLEPECGIQVLIEKSLLTISNGCLQMHDLIQEMGQFIVRECFPCNMVWVLEEIKKVMATSTRSKTVEAIVDTTLYHFADTPMACCSTEVFKTMKNLKLLDVKGKFTLSQPKYFPEDLRWLSWYLYPFQSFKINGSMTKLVGLEMQCGQMIRLQIEKKVILRNLKFMDLSFSYSVTSFPDVSGAPNLESLNLSFCSELVNVHQSVLLHERIVHLELSCCVSLKILGSSIYMKSLQTLHLNGCSSLEEFPEVSAEMTRLLVLNIDGCDMIRTLPSSILLLTSLKILTMGKHSDMESEQELEQHHPGRILPKNLPIQGSGQSSSLKVLDLRQNQLVEDNFPNNLHNVWPSLEKLGLSMNNFPRLLKSISRLCHLKYLNLSHCNKLRKLSRLPPLIQYLVADRCIYLQNCEGLFTDYKWLFKISLIGCNFYDYGRMKKYDHFTNNTNNFPIKVLVMKCAAVNYQLSITVPGRTLPEYFSIHELGDKVALKLPQTKITEIKGLAMCCRVSPSWRDVIGSYLRIMFESAIDHKKLILEPVSSYCDAGHVWMGYIPVEFLWKLCGGLDSEYLVITFCSRKKIRECGAHLVYNDDLAPMTGIESYSPRQMEFELSDNGGVCWEDLQHGKWPKPSFLCANEDINIKYLHV